MLTWKYGTCKYPKLNVDEDGTRYLVCCRVTQPMHIDVPKDNQAGNA